jgi:hypothetical protein
MTLEFKGNTNTGKTDEDPLILPDDADDFRALCWIMYAR